MKSFVKYYFQEKLTSDIRRAFTSNFFKKRKAGIDVGSGKFKNVVPVDVSLFTKFKEDFRREVVNAYRIKRQEKVKKDLSTRKKLRLELGKLYVSDAYEGEVDSGADKLEGHPISSMVYKLNNGGMVGFITTEDSDGYVRQYITTGPKGNDFFREKLGTTIQQIYADSKFSKRLITRPKSSFFKSSKEMEKITKSAEEINNDFPLPTGEPQEPEGEETSSEEPEYGVLDISKDAFDALKKMWGSGKRGEIKGGVYPFKNKFDQERYYNISTGYSGYKYSDEKGHAVYLIDTDDGENAFIGFKDRKSYDWANDLGMLKFWRTYPGEPTKILWQKGTIEELE